MGSADFRMVKPITITDAKLVDSSVPEATVVEYAAGTTYAAGDIRGVTTGTAQDVYQSLQAGNVGHAPASSATWWKTLGRVYAAYSSSTTYAKDAIVTDLASHQLYQSLIASNAGKALSDKLSWLPLGATNRWKMFDKAVSSQSAAPDMVTTTINLAELVNTVTLLNLAGSEVTVSQAASGYSRTESLVRHDVLSWYDFYYNEPVRAGDVVFDDIPPYAQSPLTVTVKNPGDTAAIGCCFVGKARTIGKTAWELTGGVISYSSDTTDAFGNVTMVKRDSAKRLNVDVYITPGLESEAYRLLKQYTDVEMVFIASTNYSMAIAYGYLGQWSVPITKSAKPAPIEIRGLI